MMRTTAADLADILRVDHAGEYGAIRIYGAQLLVARWRAPELLSLLRDTLADELRHRATFADLMHARAIRPCGALAAWGVGGWLLGLVTGLLGRTAILTCTEAVERTVHAHMLDQVRWIGDRDREVADAIEAIRIEEIAHLDIAVDERAGRDPLGRPALATLVAGTTELLVWLSTYGSSSRMRRTILERR